jgi:hypothetical protein
VHIKLQRTSKALRAWAKSKIGNNKLLLCAASKLIGIMDVVHEFRQLSEQEMQLQRDLKARFLGMTAVEKLRARQRSRLAAIRAEEANLKLFYIQTNGRRTKNVIHSLHTNFGVCYSHEEKEQELFTHFNSHFDRPLPRDLTLNWEEISLPRQDLSHLEEFSEDEVKGVCARFST